MKSMLLISLIILICGCGTTMHQLNTTCNKPTEELFNQVSSVLLSEGFLIKQNDPKIGYLQAETIPSRNIWTGSTEIRYWILQRQDSILIAYAKVSYITQNVFGATTGASELYYNDQAHKDWTWYWSIRNKIESVCENRIRFITTQKN